MNRNTLIIIGVNAVFVFGVLGIAFFGSGGYQPPAEPDQGNMPKGDFVLSVSWQPAFCETRSSLPECRRQSETSVDAKQFSLHGLWPDGASYCGVSDVERQTDERSDWKSLPETELSDAVRARLEVAMPGAISQLDRHEWIKHGTCANVDAETYFTASLGLLDAINASTLPAFFLQNMGQSISAAEVAAEFDASFGEGTGDHVSLECVTDGSRRLVSGLRIALSGEIGTEPDLGALASGAKERGTDCRGGVVDPAGLQ